MSKAVNFNELNANNSKKMLVFLKKYNIYPNNIDLYLESITHNSYANEYNLPYSYQRLEFLGDAILSQQVSLYLFRKYPLNNEGQITNLRSKMVREETLARVSRDIHLNDLILLGFGEIKSNGNDKDSILADVYESILAAIYLDKNEIVVRNFILKTLINFIEQSNFLDTIQDYKTKLQEYLQAGDKRALEYVLVKEVKMKANKINYVVHVTIDNVVYGQGQGNSLKEAQQEAAKNCLSKLALNPGNKNADK